MSYTIRELTKINAKLPITIDVNVFNEILENFDIKELLKLKEANRFICSRCRKIVHKNNFKSIGTYICQGCFKKESLMDSVLDSIIFHNPGVVYFSEFRKNNYKIGATSNHIANRFSDSDYRYNRSFLKMAVLCNNAFDLEESIHNEIVAKGHAKRPTRREDFIMQALPISFIKEIARKHTGDCVFAYSFDRIYELCGNIKMSKY